MPLVYGSDACYYFGVTAAVYSFDRRQLEGLRAVPHDRLLLKSDATHFTLGQARNSTPAYLGEIASNIAFHLDHQGQREAAVWSVGPGACGAVG